jgi:hypothetical protein
MPELTLQVAKDISSKGAKLLADLTSSSGREATIEDLTNHLQYLSKLLAARKTKDGDWSPDSVVEEIEAIQKSVLKHIGTDWKPSEVHSRFIERLRLQSSRRVCDLFTLNYDTVIEATLEADKATYIDGFTGAETAHFDDNLFDDCKNISFKLYKLHGSLNWTRDDDGTVRRRPGASLGSAKRLVIYPAEQKYFLTQFGVYELLMNRFRARLRETRPNNKLVVLGYSFCDDHINEAIIDSLRSKGSNLTVYAFIGPEKDVGAQADRIQKMANICIDRFNAVIGDKFIGAALSPADWEDVRPLELWKFESIVDLISGGAK